MSNRQTICSVILFFFFFFFFVCVCRNHYDQASNQLIYVIPFEQIQVDLSCVYYHDNKKYYRSSIIKVDQIDNSDILILEIYLVDYGEIVSNVIHPLNSTNLKFLHKDFSLLQLKYVNVV